jgi:hypothetical protein
VTAPTSAGPVVGSAVEPTGEVPRARTGTVLRVVSHLAAELPIVVLAVVELARGWRPLYDNADLALRSHQVFTRRSPLVGHEMAVSAGTHAVFGPGPVQNWLLAVPVRIDPAQGVLWGSLLAVLVAVVLTVEAGWAVAGGRGSAVASAAVLVLGLARTDVALDVAWNVWFALFFLVAAVATGVATATGRLRWWPVTVAAATIVVQCQAAFAPPAVAVCVAAPAVGVIVRRRAQGRVGAGWLAIGGAVGLALWAAPFAQEATGHPGNLTLLARAARSSGPAIGWTTALHAFGGAVGLPPSWVHPLPPPGPALFSAIAGTFAGPAWWGAAAFGLLTATAVLGWRHGRTALSACALVTFALAVGSVAAIGAVPGVQFLVVGYLGALWVVVGTAVWITLGWAAVDLVVAFRPVRPAAGTRAGARRAGVAVAVTVLVLGSAGVLWRGLDRMDGIVPALVAWPAVHATADGADAVARVAPRGTFRLEVGGSDGVTDFAVATGVAYLLTTRGLDARPASPVAYATFGRPPAGAPTVVLTWHGDGRPVDARVTGG